MENCVFCKIINKEVQSDIVFENKRVVAFKDINPKAETHILIVPKEHISSVEDLAENQKDILLELIWIAKNLAEKVNLTGYKLIFNVGRKGGQIIEHIHLHLVSGDISELP